MRVEDFPVGRRAAFETAVTTELIDAFARLSGDANALHLDDGAARELGFPGRVAHGALAVALLSRMIGMELPGAGALWRSVSVEWLRPVLPGDTLLLAAEVAQSSPAGGSLVLAVDGSVGGVRVLRGRATVAVGAAAFAADAEGGDAIATASRPASTTAAGVVEVASAEPGGPRQGSPTAAGSSSADAPVGEAARRSRPVLVTGGSGAIGGAIAVELGRLGHPVAVGFHRGADAAREVTAAIATAGGRAAPVRLDSADPASIRAAVAAAGGALGGALVALVHAASPPAEPAAVTDLDPETFERFWRVHALGGLAAAQALLPAIRERRWGRLVFLGTSYLLGAPPPHLAGYVAAKAALWGLTRSLAVEVGPLGATANLVSPSITRTRLARDASPRSLLAEAQRNPARRLAEPADAARLVGFLLGDGAAFVNGAHLPVTGGSALGS